MFNLLGFEIDFWDYVTFAALTLLLVVGLLVYCWFAGLPGRIAIARKHPEAEAVWIASCPAPWKRAQRNGGRCASTRNFMSGRDVGSSTGASA